MRCWPGCSGGLTQPPGGLSSPLTCRLPRCLCPRAVCGAPHPPGGRHQQAGKFGAATGPRCCCSRIAVAAARPAVCTAPRVSRPTAPRCPDSAVHAPPQQLVSCFNRAIPLEQGYLLMTPLRQVGGPRCVVVNRGWVPTEWREDARMRAEGQPTGKVRGVGRGVWAVPLKGGGVRAALQTEGKPAARCAKPCLEPTHLVHWDRLPASRLLSAALQVQVEGLLRQRPHAPNSNACHASNVSDCLPCSFLPLCRCGWRACCGTARSPATLCRPTNPSRVRAAPCVVCYVMGWNTCCASALLGVLPMLQPASATSLALRLPASLAAAVGVGVHAWPAPLCQTRDDHAVHH